MATSSKKSKGLFKKLSQILRILVHKSKFSHYVILLLIIGIGVFNGITGISPYWQQYQQEKNIDATFDQWWKDAGAEQFRSVGLEPTEKIRNEEYARYRENTLSQNHTFIIEERVEEMKKEYLEWWENGGGKEKFMVQSGNYPTEKDYERSLFKHIQDYTQQFLRYNMAFVPNQGNYENLLTCWLLSPSPYSYAIFAIFLMFAFIQLERRWNFLLIIGTMAAAIVCGGILVSILASTGFFYLHAGERYMGMSLALAFLLGAAAFGPKRLEISQLISGIAVLGIFADMAINWLINPGIFGAVTVLTPVLFGLGAVAGLKIETRKKTKAERAAEAMEERLRRNAERDPVAERIEKTKNAIQNGLKAAKEGMHDNARLYLSQAISLLFQENPVDTVAIKKLAEQITSNSFFVDFSSNQWLEWGEIARTKKSPEAAIMFLKKGLSLEKDPHFARRALFILGEISLRNGIDKEDGIARLEKVIQMNESDFMAKQARRLLDSLKPPTGNKSEQDTKNA